MFHAAIENCFKKIPDKLEPCQMRNYTRKPDFSLLDARAPLKRYKISPNLRFLEAHYGAYSMIIRRSGMRKILDFIKAYDLFLPFDMEYTQPNHIHLFTVTDDIVSTVPNALTDNGVPKYLKKMILLLIKRNCKC